MKEQKTAFARLLGTSIIPVVLFFFALSLFSSCEDPPDPPIINPPVDTVQNYFPPLQHSVWESTAPSELNWNEDKLQELLDYLDEKNSKGFIMLKDGKIVVEEYFDDHALNSNWNWYSCAKSLTSCMVGIAQMEGHLSINDKTSEYLGNNWSSLSQEQQDKITVRNHLSMTLGLKSNILNLAQWTGTAPFWLTYQADAGSRWAYHQGGFTLTQDIITQATGENFKQYCKSKIQDKIGMNGSWNQLFSVRVFSSTTRSMARFGLLALNKGNWDGEEIYPESYYEEMRSSSQELNKAYGYLWWLNGKEDFLGTNDQTVYTGSLIPNAPDDMFAALGAQDQKIYVIPSSNMVIVRCGQPAGNEEFASSSFDNELWGKINAVLQ